MTSVFDWRSAEPGLGATMKLEQGQIWKQGDDYLRIVEWARLSIEYKLMKNPASREGTRHKVSKKEFCRLIKGAELIQPEKKTEPAEQP